MSALVFIYNASGYGGAFKQFRNTPTFKQHANNIAADVKR